MDREIRYRVLERKSAEPFRLGKTVNMSSNGVLFTTGSLAPAARMAETTHVPAILPGAVQGVRFKMGSS